MTDERWQSGEFDRVIMELTPAALDAWLAEHGCGWTRGLYAMRAKGDTTTVGWRKPGGHGYDYQEPPALSTTGDGLVAVDAAMAARGFDLELERHGDHTHARYAYAAMIDIDGEAEHTEAPTAVALAAQAAIRNEQEGNDG